MTYRAIARRYAGALYDVALKEGHLDRIGEELRALRDLAAGNKQLKTLFESALVAPKKKRAFVEDMVRAIDGLSGEVRRLLLLLADRDRLHLLDEITELYGERLMQHHKVVRAEVTTAIPLNDAARTALTSALSRATDSRVELTEHVDPEMIGGVTAKVGSLVFDASVTTQLERLRQQLHQT